MHPESQNQKSRIVSLAPWITDVLLHFGVSEKVVGVTHLCEVDGVEGLEGTLRLVSSRTAPKVGDEQSSNRAVTCQRGASDSDAAVNGLISEYEMDWNACSRAAPGLMIVESRECARDEQQRLFVESHLAEKCGKPVKVVALCTDTLEGIYDSIERIGAAVGMSVPARDLVNRLKAQIMDWVDSFYDRMKNKRVVVVSSVSPTRIAGRWVPDIIKLASCHPFHFVAGAGDQETDWSEILTFRPDVVVVAPEGYTLTESVKTLRYLEKVPVWEDLPAVKRGEVVFCDGVGLYRPGPRLLSGCAILLSAIAGFESGYITKRDEFFRLRWVELHRHRFA
jgi:iron complex transport system substrate-binding protein